MSSSGAFEGAPRLVDLLIEEQQTLRAVDEFTAAHDAGGTLPARFETLIPVGTPGEGQQFAFAVDLDACTGCKACVTACHSLNGLELGETWRKVGEVEGSVSISAATSLSYQQTVTTACHHCESPACLAGCPVRAYEKDPITGVVVHLDDQCIGCRYCQLTCPYDVPQFSERLGIVRKCDMCHGRLAAGEAPACVQGCPNEAISIEIVDRLGAAEDMMLPLVSGGMPRSELTGPTTRYRSERAILPELQPVDAGVVTPSDGHTPLAVMLVLTQGGIGALAFDWLLGAWSPSSYGSVARGTLLTGATISTLAGLAASVLHLGRPQYAWRAFLGLLTSWMSREIVVFGAFAALLLMAWIASLSEIGLLARLLGEVPLGPELARLAGASRVVAFALGALGLFCSIKIYAVTGRPLWRLDRTALRFVGTALVLGAALSTAAWSVADVLGGVSSTSAASPGPWLPAVLAVLVLIKLVLEWRWLDRGHEGHDEAALARTRTLLAGALRPLLRWRVGFGLGFGVVLPVALVAFGAVGRGSIGAVVVSLLSVLGCLAGECVERSLFFRGEAMRGMPGSSASRGA